MIGTFLMGSAVSADTIVPTPSVVEPSVVVPETAATDEKTAEPIPATKDSMPTSVIEDTASKTLLQLRLRVRKRQISLYLHLQSIQAVRLQIK